jgi:hypothetical protein
VGNEYAINKPRPAQEKAYQSYCMAINKNPSLADGTDKDVHKWLKENGPNDYRLPMFDTWAKQVRAGRKFYGTQKNIPRAGRNTSVIKAKHNPAILLEISNQYQKPD